MAQELIRSEIEPDMEKVYYGKDKGTIRQRTSTCSGCGKKRKLFKRPFKALTPTERYKYGGYCSECAALSPVDLEKVVAERRAKPKERKPRFAYPCVGGPLAGEFATTYDFYTGGMYEHMSHDYLSYNAAGGGGPRRRGLPSMIFVHRDSLPSLISPRAR